MMTQDVASLKLCYLTSAISKHADKNETGQRERCDHCDGTGNISMVDSEGYWWSMACICPTGSRIAEAQKVPVWNGTDRQRGRTGLLIKYGAKINESQPDIYARGCAPDKDGVGDIQPATGNESRDQVGCEHTNGSNPGGVVDPMDINWEE